MRVVLTDKQHPTQSLVIIAQNTAWLAVLHVAHGLCKISAMHLSGDAHRTSDMGSPPEVKCSYTYKRQRHWTAMLGVSSA